MSEKAVSTYFIGDLLWAKIGQHPFWPCMVSYDPHGGYYYKTKKARNGEVTIYHVQYFGKLVQHGWTTSSIFPFKGVDNFFEMKVAALSNATSYALNKKVALRYNVPSTVENLWYAAVYEAEVALSVTDIYQRFETFVFKYEVNYKKPEALTRPPKRRKKHVEDSNKVSKKAREVSDVDEELCRNCEKGNVDFVCSGCLRSYHKQCLGIYLAREGLKCFDCERGLISCFACNNAGISASKCSKCIYSYHGDCLERFRCAKWKKNICSRHVCLTCFNENPSHISSKGPFVQCVRCPTIFHANEKCIPVGCVNLTPSRILCPAHHLGKNKASPQPNCNVTDCTACSSSGMLICCETCPHAYHAECINGEVPRGDFFCEECSSKKYLSVGMIIWAKSGNYRWWPARIISSYELPENIKNIVSYKGEFAIQFFGTYEYFWTHKGRVYPFVESDKKKKIKYSGSSKLDKQHKKGVAEAIVAYDEYIASRQKLYSESNSFKHISVNRAVPPAFVIIADEKTAFPCSCKSKFCGYNSNCINRSMKMECHPNVCIFKDKCENLKFQKRQYAPVKVIKTENRGWGLTAQEFISQGTFIIEYVGEVISHEEYRKRSLFMRERNIQNYYFLYLDSQRMIDAGPKGNYARFINHSCDPNCEMEKWSVNGDLRIGIFALTDISPGEELTFNYQFDSCVVQQKCNCGTSKCSGFIRRSNKDNGKKS